VTDNMGTLNAALGSEGFKVRDELLEAKWAVGFRRFSMTAQVVGAALKVALQVLDKPRPALASAPMP
jgi:hypothetical protein